MASDTLFDFIFVFFWYFNWELFVNVHTKAAYFL